MTTLLVGATGLLGPEICRQLRSAGHGVRALVRPTANTSTRAALAAMGVELIAGDLKDAGSLSRACAGANAVISSASSTLSRQSGDSIESVDRQGQLALVDAARRAGVERFVFVSFRENPLLRFPLADAKRAVERAIMSSGISYTILQSSYFMEVWLTPALGFDAVHGKVRLYGDGNHPVSWISARDVARSAALAIIENPAPNSVVELGGPEALSPRDVIRMFEAAGAGPVATETVPVADLEKQMEAATDPLQKSFAGLMLQYAGGDAIDVATSRRLFPLEMTTVRDFITAQLAAART